MKTFENYGKGEENDRKYSTTEINSLPHIHKKGGVFIELHD